jgi:cell fate regulator YaaT (PSP1 superfamily)
MGCAGCSTKGSIGLPGGCKNNGNCSTGGCGSKLDVYDWLSNIYVAGVSPARHQVIEVKFKGTRKEYFRNVYNHELETGDAVTVESATGGWDVGYVSLTGELVKLQLKKYKIDENSDMMKKVLRRASDSDMQRHEEGKHLEQETMIKARQIAYGLKLTMKISDVEYQGDRTKATFFYTAEGRVDFRELIKTLAREFKIKVEMRQIGLRQEAGRLGGIGSCGRELCCSTWLTDFHSVPTTAARYQNLFLNPLKLSGQCGRLKCCLNYELDTYIEALKEFPDENITIKTAKGIAKVEKMDILKRLVWFKYDGEMGGKFYPLELPQVQKLLEMNAQGIFPPDLEEFQSETEIPIKEVEFKDTVGEERLDRFDFKKNKKKKKGRPGGNAQNTQGQPNQPRLQENRPQNPNNPQNRDRDRGRSRNNPNQQPRDQNPNRNNPNQQPRDQNQNRNNPNQQPRDQNQNRNNPNQQPRDQNQNRNNPNQQPRDQNQNRNNNPNRGENRPRRDGNFNRDNRNRNKPGGDGGQNNPTPNNPES